MSKFQTTIHFEERSRQRGVPTWATDILYECADIELPAAGGAYVLGLSRCAARKLIQSGAPASLVARIERLCIILSPINEKGVTVLNGTRAAHAIKEARRYA